MTTTLMVPTGIADACARFGVTPVSAQRLRPGLNNRVWRITDADGASFILTELPSHDMDGAQHLVATLNHVRKEGGPSNGALGPPVEGPNGPAIMTPFAPGAMLANAPTPPLDKIAETLAGIHAIIPPAHLMGKRRTAPTTEFLQLAARDRETLRSGNRPAKLLHGDPFPDNLIASPHGIIAIDWEFAAVDDPALDIGIAIVGIILTWRWPWQDAAALQQHYQPLTGTTLDETTLQAATRYAATLLAAHRLTRGADITDLRPLMSLGRA